MTGFDDGFEAQRRRYASLSPAFSRVRLARRELAHRESEKIEPGFPRHCSLLHLLDDRFEAVQSDVGQQG